jgi:hypothetical protein
MSFIIFFQHLMDGHDLMQNMTSKNISTDLILKEKHNLEIIESVNIIRVFCLIKCQGTYTFFI